MQQFANSYSGANGFSSIGNLSGRSYTASTPTPVVDLLALQTAGRALREHSDKDVGAVPDLGEMITLLGRPSSGTYSVFPDDHRAPFLRRKMVSIPEEVYNYIETAHQTWNMGLLPEIERAWLTIDSQLILWDYVEGKELDTYAEQPDIITHVALVRPKPGVFIDDIHHILVVCTPVSVLLLGIQELAATGANGQPRKELKMYATGMSIATEVEMTAVAGTADGRIFMAGSQDGNLYELHYQEKEGWFGKRIQLVNHSVGGMQSLLPKLSKPAARADRIVSILADNTRGCFYTLTERSVVSVYQPAGEKTVQHIQTLSHLYQSAQDRAPGSPALSPSSFKICGIHVVDPSESRHGVQLLAVTTNGVRLYFSPASAVFSSYYGASSSSSSGGAQQLQLLHVRLPPTDLLHPDEQTTVATAPGQAQQQVGKSGPFTVSRLDYSCYHSGITLAAQQGDSEQRDFLMCLSPDLTRIAKLGQPQPPQPEGTATYTGAAGVISGPEKPGLVENATLLPIGGRTYGMAAAPRRSPHLTAYTPNELAVQFSEPPRNFVVLTNAGVVFMTKRRALDRMIAVLEDLLKDGNPNKIIEFRDSFGRDQTCAILLGIASGNTFLDISVTSPLGSENAATSPELANVAKQAFYDVGDRPTWSEETSYGSTTNAGNTKFSGRREGFALYLARLVRPIWKARIMTPGPVRLNVTEDALIAIQKNLFALKSFLDSNPQLFHSAPGDHAGARAANAPEQDAWRLEQKSVSELQALLARTAEAISFVLLLNDYKIEELIAKCDPETQKLIGSLTFEDLITADPGVVVSRALVNVVIDQQIGQQIGVDTVSEVLQSRCGSFCSTDDVMLYKAKENIRRAIESHNTAQGQEWLGESLRLFVRGARILDFEKLREVVGDYQHLDYAKGAIELPLYSAQAEDVDNHGRAFWHAGCPANDPRADVWERRRRRYDLVLDSLSVFDEKAAQPRASEDLQALRNHAYDLAFSADDEMFHSTLYDWLIERGHADELLESRPPYLEAHFKREPVTAHKFQLLWQYYVKDGQSLRAAEVLGALADSPQFDLSLEQRIECLTLAVGNAKSHPVSAGGRHETALAYLQDLEEKLEVAQVQLDLYHTLSPRAYEEGQVGPLIQKLRKRLFNVTELYQDYAEPFDLPSFKLLILHVSEHRDENLARSIWNQIFEEAMEEGEGERAADRIALKAVPLGQKFYPSEYAFPIRHIASLLVRFALANKGAVPRGWGPRILVQCGVPHPEVWDLFNEMYESQIPPFNEQANVQAVSSDIAVFLADWIQDASRPESNAARDLPVARMDRAVDQYIAELEPGRTETKATYEAIKRSLHRYW